MERSDEFGDNLLQSLVGLLGDLAVLSNAREQALVAALDVLGELLLEGGDLRRVQFVEVPADTAVDDGDLFCNLIKLMF